MGKHSLKYMKNKQTKRKNAFLTRIFSMMMLLFVLLSFTVPAFSEYDPLFPQNLTPTDLSATSAILIEAETGEVVFEKSADVQSYPASTTKIMSTLLGVLYGDLSSTVYVSPTAMEVPSDSSTVPLALGEEVNFEDLLYATMVTSGNEGSNVIAETVAGDIPKFVELMNSYAYALGCTNTHFNNAHGYHDEYHYTTARDMALIAKAAYENEKFRDIAGTTSYSMPKDNIYKARGLVSKNYFLRKTQGKESLFYEYGTGMKTGTTNAAGNCFVGTATKEGVTLIAVVFNSRTDTSRFTDTIKLMEYGFSQFKSANVQDLYTMNPKVVDISYYALDDEDLGKLTLALRLKSTEGSYSFVTSANNIEYLSSHLSDITITEFTKEFAAPIQKGDVMGTITYHNDNGEETVFELVATRSIMRREKLAPTLQDIMEYTKNDPNPFPRFTFEFLMLYIILPILGIYGIIRLIRFIFKKGKKRRPKVKTIEPTERYYR